MEVFFTYLKIFVFGGLLCAAAQVLTDTTKLTPARILVGYVVMGVVLTAAGLYGPFVKFAKSGATVPLTGFGYALAVGVRDAVAKDGLIGVLTGGLKGTAAGISAAITFSLVAVLFFRSREHK